MPTTSAARKTRMKTSLRLRMISRWSRMLSSEGRTDGGWTGGMLMGFFPIGMRDEDRQGLPLTFLVPRPSSLIPRLEADHSRRAILPQRVARIHHQLRRANDLAVRQAAVIGEDHHAV